MEKYNDLKDLSKYFPNGIKKKIEFNSDDVPNYIKWFRELEKKTKENKLPLD